MDDFLIVDLREYEGKSLKNVSQSEIDSLKDEKEEKRADALPEKEGTELLAFIKDLLKERVEDVVSSKRLVDSPCCLVSPKEGMSSHMERMMKMMDKEYKLSKRTLEVNLNHKIIRNLAEIYQKNNKHEFLKEGVEQLYTNALMVEGLLEHPLEILPRMYRFMEDASEYQLGRAS